MSLTKASYSMINGAPYNVRDYGAVGDGATDDTAAINLAISAANAAGGGIVYVPEGVYLIGAYTYTGVVGAAGVLLLDNVQLVIDGSLKVKNNAYGSGAFYGAVRSLDAGLTNASITGVGTIDGNKTNQTASTQCSNIYLTCLFNVVVDGLYSLNANGMGIQLVPPSSLPTPPPGAVTTHTACAVQNCFVNNVSNIGIQVSHGLYCNISENRITTCDNNCIDIYGDAGTTSPDNGITSINGNTMGGGLVGIFVETSKRVSVVGNAIDGCDVGIATNRINGAPSNISISANVVSSCPTGMFASGDTGGILVSNNSFNGFTTAGLQIGYGGGNSSYVNAFGNVFSPNGNTSPIIYVTGNQSSFNIVHQNYLTNANHNSSYLIVNDATSSINNTLELPMKDTVVQPVKQLYSGTAASGGTATLTLPSDASGKLLIKASAGGSNYSVWSGSFASSPTGSAVNQDSTTFVAGSNAIASVAASSANHTVTITFAATGSGAIWNAWVEYL